jgi:hypothetical protein
LSRADVTASHGNRDGNCRQTGWRAGWPLPPAPAPAFREGVDVLLAGTEEIEGDQHTLVLVRQGQKEWISGAILLGEVKCVNHAVPALLEPENKMRFSGSFIKRYAGRASCLPLVSGVDAPTVHA